ncbi:hypothetical protein [Streptococcus pluranimalium]|uniref:hypothetical protein n=1 Tax=Streptococcus pluranimalium TaxID=82348 RepID=UPI001F075AD0|nr:hypothetical protein [Streptococcus pluranimalium]
MVKELEDLEIQKLAKNKRNKDLQDFISAFEKQEELLTGFDEFLWETLIESVTINKYKEIKFTFKNGKIVSI